MPHAGVASTRSRSRRGGAPFDKAGAGGRGIDRGWVGGGAHSMERRGGRRHAREQVNELVELVRRFAPAAAAIISLRVDGYTFAEVAARGGLPATTVWSKLQRVREL